jgi:hypothetical protein
MSFGKRPHQKQGEEHTDAKPAKKHPDLLRHEPEKDLRREQRHLEMSGIYRDKRQQGPKQQGHAACPSPDLCTARQIVPLANSRHDDDCGNQGDDQRTACPEEGFHWLGTHNVLCEWVGPITLLTLCDGWFADPKVGLFMFRRTQEADQRCSTDSGSPARFVYPSPVVFPFLLCNLFIPNLSLDQYTTAGSVIQAEIRAAHSRLVCAIRQQCDIEWAGPTKNKKGVVIGIVELYTGHPLCGLRGGGGLYKLQPFFN